jgi:hypothetical protein
MDDCCVEGIIVGRGWELSGDEDFEENLVESRL